MLPTNENFLLEDHPLSSRGYRFILRTHKRNRTEYLRGTGPLLRGKTNQENTIKASASEGERRKISLFLGRGRFTCFRNSFTASAIGCSRPPPLTLLGPLRDCAYPNTFRSRRVKKATLTSTGTIRSSQEIYIEKILLG